MNPAQPEGIIPPTGGPIPLVQGIPVVLPPKPKKDFKKRGRFQVMSVEEDEFPNPNGTNADQILLADPQPFLPASPSYPVIPLVPGQTGEADLLAFAGPPAPLTGLAHLAQPVAAAAVPVGPANITPERKQVGRATLDAASSIASDSSDDEEEDDEDEEGREKVSEKSSHPRAHQRRHSRQLSGTLAIPPPDRKVAVAPIMEPHSPSTFELRLSRPPSVTIASPTGSVDGNNDTATLAEIQQMTEDLAKQPPNPPALINIPVAAPVSTQQGPLWHPPPPPPQYQFVASPQFHHQLPQPQFLQQPLPQTFYPAFPVYFDPRAIPSPMPMLSPVNHANGPNAYAYTDQMGRHIPATPPSVRKSSRRHHELSYEDIKFCEKIGEGTFGEVYRGTLWGQEVALKKLRLSSSHGSKEFKKEVKIMKNLRHPNIVEFLGATFETAEKMVIVTEYLPNGSLADLLEEYQRKGTKLTKKRILLIAKDVARGLNWLHHKNIIHRDLKPANLLIDPNRKVKIADFGLAHVKKTKMSNTQFYGMFGTPCYMAPEVLKKSPYDFKADVFSFGIVLCELVTGKYPYEQAPSSMMTFEKAILAGLRPEVPQNCVPAMQKLITDCWAENPNDRPTVDQIMERLFLIEEQQLALAQHSILDELPEEAHTLFLENQKRMAEMQTQIETHKTQNALLADALKDETTRRREADDRHAQCYAQLVDAQQELQRLRADAAARLGLATAEPVAAPGPIITTNQPPLLVPCRMPSDDPPSARSASGSASNSGQLELPLSARSEALGEVDIEPTVSISLESESCGEDEDESSVGHSRSVSLAEEGDAPNLPPADLAEHKVAAQPTLAPIAESPSVYQPHHHSSHSAGILSGLPRLVTGLSLLENPVGEDLASPVHALNSARRLEAEFMEARVTSPTVPLSPSVGPALSDADPHGFDLDQLVSPPTCGPAEPTAEPAAGSSSSPVSSVDPSPPSFTSVLNPSSLFSIPTAVVAAPTLLPPQPPAEPVRFLLAHSESELSLEGIPSSAQIVVVAAASPLPSLPSSPVVGARSGEVTPRPEIPLLDPVIVSDGVADAT